MNKKVYCSECKYYIKGTLIFLPRCSKTIKGSWHSKDDEIFAVADMETYNCGNDCEYYEEKMNKIKYYKGFRGWLSNYGKCPECNYYAFNDDLNDDYWKCKRCGYSDDKIIGRITHGKYYEKK